MYILEKILKFIGLVCILESQKNNENIKLNKLEV